jgi:copper chaperone
MAMLTYVVPDISCGHCKASIEGGVSQVPGVDRVEVDIESKRVVVEGEASDEAVVAAIVEAGYEEVQRQ